MMTSRSAVGSPIPLSEIESVLAWVDTFKLSRPTKKINRDFSDAVLLAEILGSHYPKLVEMHNYPPRNSHSLKLNNWMTLNRKVLKKLKLTLCVNTMEQLANSSPGVIERVLVMVRDKIKRDEELEKSMKEGEQNVSSGGSYYEACGDDEHVLVVPVKTRVNGVLETVQQKVVSHEAYLNLKEDLKVSQESVDILKQKVEHLDNLIKLKDERINELQKQLERKQSRRKDTDIIQDNAPTAGLPFEEPPSPTIEPLAPTLSTSKHSVISDSKTLNAQDVKEINDIKEILAFHEKESREFKEIKESKIPSAKNSKSRIATPKASFTQVTVKVSNEIIDDGMKDVDRIKSDVFKELEDFHEDVHEEVFKDVEPVGQDHKEIKSGVSTTIEETIQMEVKELTKALDNVAPDFLS